ncbi:MAG: hypothetical protein Q9190_008082 [Brigantiaea leucoxantha]
MTAPGQHLANEIPEANAPCPISEVDTSFFILSVDLWSAEGSREVNLVRHSQTSPSISAATSASYPPPPQPTPPQNPYTHGMGYQVASIYPPSQTNMNSQQNLFHPNSTGYQTNLFAQPPSNPYQQQQALPLPQLPSQPQQNYYTTPTGTPMTPTAYYQTQLQNQAAVLSPHQFQTTTLTPDPRTTPPTGMFTRNLIGSLSVSAFKLTDPNGELGIWFILQDLSVRTEGTFR